MSDIHKDMICQVLASERSERVVSETLKTFLGEYEAASLDNDAFAKAVTKNGEKQTFYWRGKNDLMLGAHLTSDNKLVVSLTLDGTDELADQILEKLKSHLESETGIISTPFPAEYSDGKDFAHRYGGVL